MDLRPIGPKAQAIKKARPLGPRLRSDFSLYIQNIKLAGVHWTFAEVFSVNAIMEMESIV